jgi:arginyl-tRNA synthetase
MFEQEQQLIAEKINAYCASNNIPVLPLKWMPIPFSGEWGISTSFFAAAAAEAKAGKSKGTPVPVRAQELAEAVLEALGAQSGISHGEAVKGYLNLYFPTAQVAHRVVETVPDSAGGPPGGGNSSGGR